MTKNKRTPTDKISILELYKIHKPKEIVLLTGIPKSTISHILRFHRVKPVTSHETIDRIIHQIILDEESEGINYDKQESCLHPHHTLDCPHCHLKVSEKNRTSIVEHITRQNFNPEDRELVIAIFTRNELVEKLRTEQMI